MGGSTDRLLIKTHTSVQSKFKATVKSYLQQRSQRSLMAEWTFPLPQCVLVNWQPLEFIICENFFITQRWQSVDRLSKRQWSWVITLRTKFGTDASIAHTGKQFRVTWANGGGASSKTRGSRAVTTQQCRCSKQSWQPYGSQDEAIYLNQRSTIISIR